MVIDSHIHLYPSFVYENASRWGNENSESYWLNCVLPDSGPQLQGWATVDQLLTDMDAAGVNKAVIQSWYWENHDTCIKSQSWQIDWVNAHPDRLMAFAPFNAKGGNKAIELLKHAFDSGLSGIGELNPPVQGYNYDDPILDQALLFAAQANKPVNFHVTEPTGRTHSGKTETPFGMLQAMALRHPNTKFIFAHLGGLLPFHEFNRHTKKALANVWYDTAAVPLLYDKSVYRKLCDSIDPSRIIFGTDYPLRTFPKTQERPSFQNHLESLRSANLTEEELRGIIGKNLTDLLF